MLNFTDFLEAFDFAIDWDDPLWTCPNCDGVGWVDGAHPLMNGVTCTWCDGDKELDIEHMTAWLEWLRRPSIPEKMHSHEHAYPHEHRLNWLIVKDSDLFARSYGLPA